MVIFLLLNVSGKLLQFWDCISFIGKNLNLLHRMKIIIDTSHILVMFNCTQVGMPISG